MNRIVWDRGFNRIYKKRIKCNDDLKKKFWEAIALFAKTPFNPIPFFFTRGISLFFGIVYIRTSLLILNLIKIPFFSQYIIRNKTGKIGIGYYTIPFF